MRSLHEALKLAAPGGFVRSFLDEGDVIQQLLRDDGLREGSGAEQEFVRLLLHAAGSPSISDLDIAQPLESLTEREREILVFLGNGVSNREMANRIFVSENTVKFHLKNIYSKLSVSTRLQAVAAARQIGLIR
jgi:LuxR family maltose regulon positive regulatory protein